MQTPSFRLRLLQSPLVVLLLALAFAACLRADATLAPVRHAQALLGADTWSRVIRIENAARGSRYPATLHALVFELAGLLWFYTPVDGTQSFSLYRENLAAEKADFAPLLRDIEPGFAHWTEVPAPAPLPPVDPLALLPNGCFIESVAALRAQLERGAAVAAPRLLSYYIDTRAGRVGHTVLVYEERGRVVVVDPAEPHRPFGIATRLAPTPLLLARAFAGEGVAQARAIGLEAMAQAVLARAHPTPGGGRAA